MPGNARTCLWKGHNGAVAVVFGAAAVLFFLGGDGKRSLVSWKNPSPRLVRYARMSRGIRRTNAEWTMILWSNAMIAELKINRYGIKREDAATNNVWMLSRTWRRQDKGVKHRIMQGVGFYFMDLNVERIPRGVIRSHEDGSMLAVMLGTGNIVIGQ